MVMYLFKSYKLIEAHRFLPADKVQHLVKVRLPIRQVLQW